MHRADVACELVHLLTVGKLSLLLQRTQLAEMLELFHERLWHLAQEAKIKASDKAAARLKDLHVGALVCRVEDDAVKYWGRVVADGTNKTSATIKPYDGSQFKVSQDDVAAMVEWAAGHARLKKKEFLLALKAEFARRSAERAGDLRIESLV